jgi:hypothetical protein
VLSEKNTGGQAASATRGPEAPASTAAPEEPGAHA